MARAIRLKNAQRTAPATMRDILRGGGLRSIPVLVVLASERDELRVHCVVMSCQRNQRCPMSALSGASAATVPPCHRKTVTTVPAGADVCLDVGRTSEQQPTRRGGP